MAYTGNGAFGGLDARRAAADGAIRDMENMSLRFSPALASRKPRRKLDEKWNDFGGAYYGERDFVVHDKRLYDDGAEVCALSSGEKSMAMLGKTLYIFPDKVAYNTELNSVKRYNANVNNVGSVNSKPAYIDYYFTQSGGDVSVPTYYASGIAFPLDNFPSFPFEDGDWVHIKITKCETNSGGLKSVDFDLRIKPDEIRYETGNENYGSVHVLKLPTETFSSIVDYKVRHRIEVQVEYGVPDLDFVFASDNRLWGSKGTEIYASALGQGMVWIDYDTLTTSSWAATTKTGDNITAALDFGGMPVFFAENAAYKIYGENPKEFQYVRQELIGVTAGDHKSVAVGAGYIFYLTRRGIYAWTGGVPQLISAPLGEERITNAVGGSDGAVYYLSCEQGGRHNLYCYDPMTNAWIREDALEAVDIKQKGRDLCLVAADGNAYLIGDVYSTEGTAISPEGYFLETADYNDGAVVQKSAKNILVQYELTDGEADVMVSYDGEPWNHVYTLYDTDGKKITSVIPLQEKRYRTMRIRIEGDGEIVIYYIVRDVNVRTERPGGERNVYI